MIPSENKTDTISRKQALAKLSTIAKYAGMTAAGTFLILQPKRAQAQSPDSPGENF